MNFIPIMAQINAGGDDRSLSRMRDLLLAEIHPMLRELFEGVKMTWHEEYGQRYFKVHLRYRINSNDTLLEVCILTCHAFCRCFRQLPEFRDRGAMFVLYAKGEHFSPLFDPIRMSGLYPPRDAETHAANLTEMELEPVSLPEPESFNVQVRELTELSREFNRRACETFLDAIARGVPKDMKAPLKRSRLQVAAVPPSRCLDLVIDCATDDDFWALRSRTSELAAAICKVLPQMGLLDTPSFVLRCEGLVSPAFDPVSHAKQS